MDPRLLKQLLLAQWTTSVSPLDASPSAPADGGGLFGNLLSQMMNASPAEESLSPAAPQPLGVPAASFPSYIQHGALAGDPGSSSAYDGLISAAASKYGLDPALIKGVMEVESSFDAHSVSASGAKGLMQLMDDTARGLGVSDSFDPAQNIDGGARFLSYLVRKYNGNVSSALAGYNAGPNRVDRLGLSTDSLIRDHLGELPVETQRYVPKVLAAAQRWSERG